MFICFTFFPIVLAPLYFISFQIVAGFIIQNLFILIIIQAFEYSEDGDSSEKLQESLENFKVNWRLEADPEQPYKLNERKLILFLKSLNKPLGIY